MLLLPRYPDIMMGGKEKKWEFLGTSMCAYKPVPEVHELAGLAPVVNCWLCYSVTLEVTCKTCLYYSETVLSVLLTPWISAPAFMWGGLRNHDCIKLEYSFSGMWLLTKHIKVRPMFNSIILKNITLSLEELCVVPSVSASSLHVLVEDLSWQCLSSLV